MSNNMNKKVFVYGSLKQGFGNHRLLESATFLGLDTTPPDYTMYSLGGFPGIIPKGNTPIQGEVYEVDQDQFERLDMLEGYPSFYNRKLIDTAHGDAWIYYLNGDDGEDFTRYERVDNGVW